MKQETPTRLVRRSAIEKQVRVYLAKAQNGKDGTGSRGARIPREAFEKLVQRGVTQTLRQLRQLGTKVAD